MRVADMPDDERYVAEAILRAEQTWMVDLPKGFVARLTAQLALPARDAAIRISERRKVRAELLAMASLYERVGESVRGARRTQRSRRPDRTRDHEGDEPYHLRPGGSGPQPMGVLPMWPSVDSPRCRRARWRRYGPVLCRRL